MDYSLTNPQNSIWLTEKFYTGTAINNISGYAYIDEAVEFKALKKAINEVIKTNDAMRIKIKEVENSCVQYISDYTSFDIETIEISSKNDIEKKALELAKIPFNMNGNLLFKFILYKLPNNYGGFFLSAHHLIGDSWSLGLVVKQIMATYSDIKKNTYISKECPSYTSYIKAEKEYLKSDKFNKDKSYWDDVFKTVPETASIPSFKKVSNTTCNGDRVKICLDADMVNKINKFCKENMISLYNFFMSVYSLYLGRVSSLDDFVIGTPILNRTNFEQKNTMGMFISTAPLRIDLNHELSFKDFVKDISINTMSLFRHQKYPYQYILENLRKKDSSIPNLYNVVLSYQITKTFDEENGIKYTAEWLSNGCCADDMQIHLFDLNDEGSINVAYDYKTDKYDKQDITDLHARILTIINQVISNNNILLKDIEIVTAEEKHKILYEFNDTYADYPKDKTIVDLFEEQVEKTPDNIAVVFEDQKLTYRELNEKANQLARYILLNDIKSGSTIGIMINRSLEMIIGILAILKCGNSYLPLDPTFPIERINYILGHSGVSLVLSNDNTSSLIPDIFKQININLSNNIYCGENTNQNIKCSANDLIYLIYTSGSTGNPKGVMVTNRNLTNFLFGIKNCINFSSEEVFLSVTTICFDIFALEAWYPLIFGLKLIVANEYEQTSTELLNKLCIKNKVNIIQTTPSRFNDLLLDKNNLTFFKNLTHILVGGEPLPRHLIQSFMNVSNANIYNMYGPTETTVWSTINKINQSDKISIGTPIINTQCYILDENSNILPPYTPGILYIGGDGVSLGYKKQNDLTKLTFINSPFNKDSIIYNTKDLAYYDKFGNLYHLGRSDFQIKLRGYRIELEEIENKALSFKNITNAVSSHVNNKYLVLYFTCNDKINVNDLRKYLSSTLPSYMVPTFYKELSTFSFTPNGKIDRKKLPNIEEVQKIHNILPRNDIDKYLIDLLCRLLNEDNINISDTFFSIGGDSLIAINFATQISAKFDINISVANILENQVIMDLSDYISSLKDNTIISINKVETRKYYPLSSAQKRIYYSSKLDKNSTLYNIAGGLVLDKELDIDKLKTCFKTLINRHESLRTHFDVKDNEIVQIIDKDVNFDLELENSNTDNLNKIYHNFIRPFDLTKAPLFRSRLVKLSNNKMLFLLDMHHIISDGSSLNILMQELCSLYNGETLSNKEIDYKDFTIWEQEQFNTEEFNKSKEYWLDQFNDEIPLLNMPTTYPRPSNRSFEGSNYHTILSKEVFDKINKMAKDLNITPYMLMLSCYYILLSKYTSQDDIVVGSPIIGRELPELSNVLGMFVNSLALRNKIDSSVSFEIFSRNIKENCLNSFRNQNYPFNMLVNDLNITLDTSRNPLFDTMFIFQSEGYPSINFKGTNGEYFIPDNNISKFDLSLEVLPINNEYSLRFEYCTKLFDEDFIKRLSSHYINILNAVLSNNQITISDIDIISKEEKHQILYDFNNTKVDYPKDKTVVELFEEQVEKTPNKTAIIFENQKLTYRELNEKSNQLARFLQAKSIKHEDIVCLLLDKSLESIVGMLAILKCGAAFLPIDVAYPKERIDYIITNSNSKVLLTTQAFISKANYSINTFCIDLDNSLLYSNSCENINTKKVSSKDLAYIMYTSGSTGNPKGVMVTNRNILRLVKNNAFIKFDKNERILQTGSIVFDACTFEIWGALLNGFELHIITKMHLLDPIYLKNYIDKEKITSLFITTQLFNQLCEADPLIFNNMNNLLTGGEAVSVGHMNIANEKNPNLNIIHCYGPTENTTFSTCYDVPKSKFKNTVPIGSPISNSTCYVVFPSGNLCPTNVPGELWVGGDGVAKGYLNNEELSKDKFIDNPFGTGKIYKTGDLVKWLPDGNIEFVGRIDNQVKIRGFRIELSEIDSKILEFPQIKYSITVTNTVNNDRVICSYFVSENEIDIEDLKSYLQKCLPYFMIPSYIMQLEHFDLNINGKIDKKCLPTDFRKIKKTRRIEIPKTQTEKNIINVFKNVFNTEDISISDDLFKDLHGDSLTAMKIQIEALSENMNIDYADIFKYSTIKSLASHLDNKNKEKRIIKNNIDDFSKYDSILSRNSVSEELEIKSTQVDNVLLTGFTGFLGAHILDSFIKKENGTIYCLIRDKNQMTAEERLYNVLHFYFNKKYDKYVGNRIKLVEGDLTSDNFGLPKADYISLGKDISTVIHSAALVKHYGMYEDFEKANVFGTQRIVDFCTNFKLRLLHISTLSVSGNNFADGSKVENNFDTDVDFNETNFYIGQNIEGLYAKSKFEAEHIVLEAIYNSKLAASILRMGNLTSRYSEGKFQQNHFENAFVNRFKSFLQIGAVPDYMLKLYAEFTPIDYCGDAIIEIARHFNKNYTVFHLMNEKRVYLDRLFDMMRQIGIDINVVTEKEFVNIINNLLANDKTKMYIEGIINDFDKSSKHLVYESKVKVQSDFSKLYLEKLGFSWPNIDINYIKNYFKYLFDIGYLNIN